VSRPIPGRGGRVAGSAKVEACERSGLKATCALEQLNCRMPSAEEAALLNISRGQPIIDMDRWVWADDGTLFEYTHIVANGALHEFTYAYDLDEEASQ